MFDAKSVNTLLGNHTKLLLMQFNQTKIEKNVMTSILYENHIGSIMYDMVYNRSYLAYAFNMVSQFIENSNRVH